ncbi:MAG: fibronectin type III domain-containing protein [Kiritimatiellae bacterium]|nr:fibronectin type III domain-containing protein [Kiritimatiellia bacterium]
MYFAPRSYRMAVSAVVLAGFCARALHAGNANIGSLYVTMNPSDFNAVNSVPKEQHATKLERPCTVAFRYPGDSTDRFKLKCGFRNHGALGVHQQAKRSFRLKFRGPEYGNKRLNYPVFERAPLHKFTKTGFDNLVLRAGGNEATSQGLESGGIYKNFTNMLDEWGRATQIDMSGYGNHGTYVNLYINGSYWGLYNLTERADRAWAQMHFGGTKRDWVSYRDTEGDLARWNSALSVCRTAKSRSISQIREYIDPETFADYIMLGMYAGTWDWSKANSWCVTRATPAGKTYWTVWDAEHFLRGITRTTKHGHYPKTNWADMHWKTTPEAHFVMFNGLIENPAFKQVFSDRARKHLKTSGGALTDAASLQRWDTLVNFIKNDMQADINRWNATWQDWEAGRAELRPAISGNANAAFNVFNAKGWIVPEGGNPPATPGSLTATAQSSTRIQLSWKDNSNDETGFKIDRRRSGTTDWVRIATPGAGATAYADSGLAGATRYYYQVKAYNAAGNSPYSNMADATTPSAAVPKIAVSTTSITVSCEQGQYAPDQTFQVWNDGTGTLQYNAVETSSTMEIAPTSGSSTGSANRNTHTVSFPRNDLAAGTYNRTITVEDDGSGAANGPVTIAVAITITEPQQQPPAPPSGLTAAAKSSTRVDLAWTDNSGDETRFKIDRRRSGTTTWARIAEPAANTTAYADTGLSPETKYYYQVKAYNAAGNSPYSNLADATTPADAVPQAPAAPGALNATAKSATRVDLAWADNSGDETCFKIDRRQSGTTVWIRIAQPAADVTSCADAGLTAGTTYYYKVKANNAAGNSPYSNVAATTTPAGTTQPAAPADLAASAVSDSAIGLSWTDRSDNEDGFKVDRRQSGFSEWIRVDRAPADATAYTDTGLLAGKRYYYKIKAYNAAGNSSYTALAYAGTMGMGTAGPAMPTAAADEDALPDVWETGHGLDPDSNDMDADLDGDGFRNYEEYVAGSDPADGTACLRVELQRIGSALVVTFQTVAAGPEYGGLTRYYLLERCVEMDDDSAWAPVDGYTRIRGDGQRVSYTHALDDAIPACYRARVWLD